MHLPNLQTLEEDIQANGKEQPISQPGSTRFIKIELALTVP